MQEDISNRSESGLLAPQPKHVNNFDFLRLLLASLVIVSHSYQLGTGNSELDPLFRISHQRSIGNLCVFGFFALSGFLITQSWERRRSVFDYGLKRFARIYPGFIVMSLVCVFLIPFVYTGQRGYLQGSLGHTFHGLLALQGLPTVDPFPNNIYPHAMNASAWTVLYEFRCYILVALLGLLGLLSRRWVITALFAILVICSTRMTNEGQPTHPIVVHLFSNVYMATIFSCYFFAGMVVLRWRKQIRFSNGIALLALAAIAATVRVPHGWDVTLPTAGIYLLFWFAFHPRIRLRNFARFGDFSYGTYLYAFPIQQSIVHFAGGSMAPWLLFIVALPLSLLAGALSWHLIEKWPLRWSHGSRKRPGPIIAGDLSTAIPSAVPG